MSRGYYPEPPEFYRRPGRPLPMTMPSGEREPIRPYSVVQRIQRQSTPHEAETDRGGNQNRRRIAVAVSLPSFLFHRNMLLALWSAPVTKADNLPTVFALPQEENQVQW